MFCKKIGLTVLSVATLGVFVAACSSSGGGGSHKLDNGTYAFASTPAASVASDTCFNTTVEAQLLPLLGSLSFTVTTSNGTFTVTPPGLVSTLIPPISGTVAGNNLSATGATTTPLVVTSVCSLGFSGDITGTLFADDQFHANFALGINAAVTNSQGGASDCSAEVGSTFSISGVNIPFPTLTPTNNGACALTIAGDIVIQ